MMKKTLLMLTSLAMFGCDDPQADNVATQAAQATQATASSTKRQAKWSFEYRGDVSGQVGGDLLTATGMMNNLTIVGKAYGGAAGTTAPQQLRLSIQRAPDGSPGSILMNLTLVDGTKCQNAEEVEADIRDAEYRTVNASFSGMLDCGGKSASFEGWVNADP